MKIEWLGHAAFLATTDGTRIVTDPFGGIGIDFPKVEADLVTVSHDHSDHSETKAVGGTPQIVNTPGSHELAGVKVTGLSTFHDESDGQERGTNIIYMIEAEGLRLCHLGDLGHQLTVEQVSSIGHVDVLFVPVGGTYTVDATGAWKIVEMLKPVITVPMHYKIENLTVNISPLDEFIERAAGPRSLDELVVTTDSLPKAGDVVVLKRRT